MLKKNKVVLAILSVITYGVNAQEIPDTQVEPVAPIIEDSNIVAADAMEEVVKDSVVPFKKVKLDGIASVVGDHVILDSDIEKALIDLKSQGASPEDYTHCSLLGSLMEERLYAHQAVQDSILVSDDEVNATGDRQLQSLVQQIGSMDKVLKYYKKNSETDFREELFKINKLRMLSDKMKGSIVGEVEVTPEEVRQFFNNIPENERPVFGAEMEIAQIVKAPKPTEKEVQKVKDKLNAIKSDVEDNDASFNVKAILYSQDPGSKSKGGFYSISKKSSFDI